MAAGNPDPGKQLVTSAEDLQRLCRAVFSHVGGVVLQPGNRHLSTKNFAIPTQALGKNPAVEDN
ncbi:hypothetical protein BA177_00210 [Woeseia oceani]|uniref:Uncharacterized protein n=1 Tax=Woeseia oceani TaxID=1548547 RepID=A0A193LBH4_9GAMM|nr:hypothetical protein BA177_00210 [Woeseia oceani]